MLTVHTCSRGPSQKLRASTWKLKHFKTSKCNKYYVKSHTSQYISKVSNSLFVIGTRELINTHTIKHKIHYIEKHSDRKINAHHTNIYLPVLGIEPKTSIELEIKNCKG